MGRGKKTRARDRSPFQGYQCSWCIEEGNPQATIRYRSQHCVIYHAVRNHDPAKFYKPLFPVDLAEAEAPDVTEPVKAHLLHHPCDLPDDMFCIEQPPPPPTEVKRHKSHRGHKIRERQNYVTKPDGTTLLDEDGKPVPAYEHVPSQISSKFDPAYIERLRHENPELTTKAIRARMQNRPKMTGGTAFTNTLQHWREDESKGFLYRPPLSQSNEKVSIPFLKLLDSLNPRQVARNTFADVDENGRITQPEPKDLEKGEGENWNPRPLDPWRNGDPHVYGPQVQQGFKLLAKAKQTAADRGLDHWTELSNVDIEAGGIGGRKVDGALAKTGTKRTRETDSNPAPRKAARTMPPMQDMRQPVAGGSLPVGGGQARHINVCPFTGRNLGVPTFPQEHIPQDFYPPTPLHGASHLTYNSSQYGYLPEHNQAQREESEQTITQAEYDRLDQGFQRPSEFGQSRINHHEDDQFHQTYEAPPEANQEGSQSYGHWSHNHGGGIVSNHHPQPIIDDSFSEIQNPSTNTLVAQDLGMVDDGRSGYSVSNAEMEEFLDFVWGIA